MFSPEMWPVRWPKPIAVANKPTFPWRCAMALFEWGLRWMMWWCHLGLICWVGWKWDLPKSLPVFTNLVTYRYLSIPIDDWFSSLLWNKWNQKPRAANLSQRCLLTSLCHGQRGQQGPNIPQSASFESFGFLYDFKVYYFFKINSPGLNNFRRKTSVPHRGILQLLSFN